MLSGGAALNAAFLPPKAFVDRPELLDRRFAPDEARAYTRWLARSHYENFHVVSLLLPRRLHQDFFNLYAFCRWADDLGDEIGDRERSLRLLAWWEGELEALYRGQARHPVFVALKETVERQQLPRQPLADLIRAFVQDQTVTRYQTFDELLGYCRYSANPVGRLVLHLCGYRDEERQRLSDATCTGLQLANFWQDVTLDFQKGRLYLPLELLDRHGASVEDIRQRRPTPGFRAAMREAVEVAEQFFRRGLPLCGMVAPRLALDIDLFSRGGLRLLEKIRRRDYDVLAARPVITRTERFGLLVRGLVRLAGRVAQ